MNYTLNPLSKNKLIWIPFFVFLSVHGSAQTGTSSSPRTIQLDCLDINKIRQATGRPQAVGEHANLSIHNRKYLNGIHTRAESQLYIQLDGNALSFSAEVGVDDRSTAFREDTVKKETSTAEFFVIGDGRTLWQSGVMKYGDNSKTLNVALRGVKQLVLKVTGAPGHTHADWVNGLFQFMGSPPFTTWSPEDRAVMDKTKEFRKLQDQKFPKPRINGAMRTGIRPGTPFYYPIAVTGMRPIQFSAAGLPGGLILDKRNGIISGSVAKEGIYQVVLTATNSYGQSIRSLKIEVGDQLALTPPMGYLSWNVVEGLISETYMLELADAFKDLGLIDVGYQYINMDDCWQGGRDSGGRIFPDRLRFPRGLKPVGDYLHAKGLKLGLYTSPGPVTCAGYQGSMNYEALDVATWASWGVDYLKHDGCSVPPERAQELYGLMGTLLKASGRSIVYCGRKDAGSQLWRIGGDLRDQWSIDGRDVGILQSFEKAIHNAATQSPGAWVDPDMLVVGIYGKGGSANDKTNEKGCTDIEYRSHMSLWALMSAPLFITADIRRLNAASLETLTNPEVIDVNQDPLGSFPERIGEGGEAEVWVKKMEDGSRTVALFNKSPAEKKMAVSFKDIHLKASCTVRDLWQRKDMGVYGDAYSAPVPSHGVVLIRVYPEQ